MVFVFVPQQELLTVDKDAQGNISQDCLMYVRYVPLTQPGRRG
jgi:protein-L-isoaspartate O-methyltransferase